MPSLQLRVDTKEDAEILARLMEEILGEERPIVREDVTRHQNTRSIDLETLGTLVTIAVGAVDLAARLQLVDRLRQLLGAIGSSAIRVRYQDLEGRWITVTEGELATIAAMWATPTGPTP